MRKSTSFLAAFLGEVMGDRKLQKKSATQLYRYLYERVMGKPNAFPRDPFRQQLRGFYKECQDLCDTHEDVIPRHKLLKLISKVKNSKKSK